MPKTNSKRKYLVIKQESYSYSSFSLKEADKNKLFRLTKQAFGKICEQKIAAPILIREFQTYDPAILIQEAWDQLCLKMRKLYRRRYKMAFKEDWRLLRGGFQAPSELFTDKDIERDNFPYCLSDRTIEKKLKTELEYSAHLMGNEFWLTPEGFPHDRDFKISTSWANFRLYEIIRSYRRRKTIRKFGPYRPTLVEKMMIDEVRAVYKKLVLRRFPNVSAKNLAPLEQCLSCLMKEDFFCVPKSNSYREYPFYFIEVKGERVKTSKPSLTSSQKWFFQKYNGKVGLLILWVFLRRDGVEVKWIVPSSDVRRPTLVEKDLSPPRSSPTGLAAVVK